MFANGAAIVGAQGARIDVISAGAHEAFVHLDNGDVLKFSPYSFGRGRMGLLIERRPARPSSEETT
jgi:hypothetical protein